MFRFYSVGLVNGNLREDKDSVSHSHTLSQRLKAWCIQGKTAITEQRGQKLNPGKSFPRVSGGYEEMIPPFFFFGHLSFGSSDYRASRVGPFLLFFP